MAEQKQGEGRVVFLRPKSLLPVVTNYCPGCPHGIVHRLVAEVIDELDIEGRTVGVAPVGCAVTAPDFFGPTRVLDSEQGKGLGKALLLRCLYALREEGYAYAIIGGVGPVAFYEKCVGAHVIPDSTPGVYKDFLGAIERGIMGTTKD